MYSAVNADGFSHLMKEQNYSVVFLDESLRFFKKKRESIYVVAAVQPRFDSKDRRGEQLEEVRSGLVSLAEDVFGRPYWHTVEAWQIDGGKTAEKMCELIAQHSAISIGISSVSPSNKGKVIPVDYMRARTKALNASLKVLTSPSSIIVFDRVRRRTDPRKDDAEVMSLDVKNVAVLRKQADVPVVHASTRVVHTSQSSDPILWAADLAASAASRSLLGDFRLLDALAGGASGARLVVAADVPARRVFQRLWQEHVETLKGPVIPQEHTLPNAHTKQAQATSKDEVGLDPMARIEQAMQDMRRRKRQAAEESTSAHALRSHDCGRSGPTLGI